VRLDRHHPRLTGAATPPVSTAVTLAFAALFALAFTAAWPLLGHLDNRLEEPMTSLKQHLRTYLGIAGLHHHIDELESNMADWNTVLNGLVEQTTATSAAQATSFSNLQNGLNAQGDQIRELRQLLDDAIANQGTVTPEMQAKVDEISQSLTTMKDAADSADNGFEPVEPVEPEQPTVPVTPDDTTPAGNTSRR